MTRVGPARSAAALERLRMRFEQAAERAAAGDYALAARELRSLSRDLAGGPPSSWPARVSTLLALAEVEQTRGRFAEAESLASEAGWIAGQAIEMAGRRGVASRALAEWRHAHRRARLQCGTALRALGRYAEAEALYLAALAEAQAEVGPDGREVGDAHVALGVLCKYTRRYAEAREHYETALAIPEAQRPRDERSLCGLVYNLAGLLHAEGRFEEALAPCREALARRERLVGRRDHPQLALHLCQLAAIHEGLRRFDEAEALYREVLATWIATFGERHPDVALTLNNLATTLQVQGRYDEAEALHQRALALRLELLGPDHPQVATSRHNLARLRERRGSAPRPAKSSINQVSPHRLRLTWNALFGRRLERRTIGVGDE